MSEYVDPVTLEIVQNALAALNIRLESADV